MSRKDEMSYNVVPCCISINREYGYILEMMSHVDEAYAARDNDGKCVIGSMHFDFKKKCATYYR